MISGQNRLKNEIGTRARFDFIRYSNCWEDADVLLEAINPKEGGRYLSIASAGDNSLAILSRSPSLVLAVDISPAQLACAEIRKAAFRNLAYEELLEFLGISAGQDRSVYYGELRNDLSDEARSFWDQRPDLIRAGVIHVGKFEKYFSMFRNYVLPLVHTRKQVERLLSIHDAGERAVYYRKEWNTPRWRLLFKVFFSRGIMGRLGRDPEFFRYVESDVSSRIFRRAEYALAVLPTDANPYLEYILTGNFKNSLPLYLRPENFLSIRNNLDKLIIFRGDIKQALQNSGKTKFDGLNLSDIFEYMSMDQYKEEISRALDYTAPGARIVYWNMLADRSRIDDLSGRIRYLDTRANELFRNDKAFFYKSLIIAEAI